MIQSLIDALPLPSLVIDPQNRLVAANEGAVRVFGAGLQGRNYITVMRQPSMLRAVEAALERAETSKLRLQTNVARRDVNWLATVAHVDMPTGAHALVTLEDLTAMHEAGQMRRDFVANVSHELRTPLTALLGFIETLRGAARDDPNARERFLGIMEQEARRMNRLVDDLLSLSRVEADERLRPTASVDLSAILNSTLSALRPMTDAESITIDLRGPEEALDVPGDGDQLSQVFTNLVENAVKYSGKGANVVITLAEEETDAQVRGPVARVTIADNGPGIEPRHIPRLTERFYRVDTHRSREMGGTGLGLAIVKHIVNRHRGRLLIASTLGQGSRFSVVLPRR